MHPRLGVAAALALLLPALGCAARETTPASSSSSSAERGQIPTPAPGEKPSPAGKAVGLFNRAQERLHRHDRRGAEALLKAALAENPKLYPAHFALAGIHEKEGRAGEAVAAHRKVIALKPDHVESHVALGRLYENARRIERALYHYQRAVDLDPGAFVAHFRMGLIRRRRGQLAAAVERLRAAADLRPAHRAARHWLWLSVTERGRAPDWEIALGRRLIEAGDTTPVRFYQGRAARHFGAGRIDAALREIQKAVDVNPNWRAPEWRSVLSDMARYRRRKKRGPQPGGRIDRRGGRIDRPRGR
ncbi:MAG: tetratricopeptide repeat protein [bacterium]